MSKKQTENLMLICYRTAKQGKVSQYFLKTMQKIKLSLSFSTNGTPSKIQNMHIPIILDMHIPFKEGNT